MNTDSKDCACGSPAKSAADAEFGMEIDVARKAKKKTKKNAKKSIKRREWTSADEKLLKKHSRERTPIAKLSKAFKRTPGALRQKAFALGIGLGHQR